MHYRVGELADLFGLTKEGIRYYERKGLISSSRDEKNNYRYYTRNQITTLKHIRMYEGLGFSLEEAVDMLKLTSLEQTQENLAEKIQELQKKEQELLEMKNQLSAQYEAVLRIQSGSITLREAPESYFLHRAPDEHSACNEAERQRIMQLRSTEKAWIAAMPSVYLFAMHYDQDLNPIEDQFGSIVPCETAHRLGLPTEGAVHLPRRLCVCGSSQSISYTHPPVHHLVSWAHEHGYALCGDIGAIRRTGYQDKDGTMWSVHDLYLPVRPCHPNKND